MRRAKGAVPQPTSSTSEGEVVSSGFTSAANIASEAGARERASSRSAAACASPLRSRSP